MAIFVTSAILHFKKLKNFLEIFLKGELKYVAGKAVYYFLGIPYAQAPMADLRFEPPQKHPGWQVRNFRNIPYESPILGHEYKNEYG